MAHTYDFDYFYTLEIGSNKKLVDFGATQNRFPKLQKGVNLLEGVPSRGGTFAIYESADGTQASGTVTWGATVSHGAGASNAAFTFTAGSTGACTVTIGSVTGLTITGSGTAATDATALAAVIVANATLAALFTVTTNAGDVRMVSKLEGGYNFTTTVTATGGAKLTAAAATLTGGTPTGALGSVVVGGHTEALGNVGDSATVCVSATATAANIAAQLLANSAIQLIATTSAAYSTDVVATVTADVNPAQAELGNLITLTATVGSASGAVLSGGVNATDNTSVY